MAFFNTLKSKLSDAAEITAKKTGEYSEIAKLKLRENKLKSEIEAIYTEVGKLIYKQYQEKTDETQAIAEKCLAIDEKNAAIAQVNADLDAVKAKAAADKKERAQAKAMAAAPAEASAPAEEAPSDFTASAEETAAAEEIPADIPQDEN